MAGEAGTRQGYWGRTYGVTQQGPSPSFFSRSSLLLRQTQGCGSLLTSFRQSHVLLQTQMLCTQTPKVHAHKHITHNAQTNPVHTRTHTHTVRTQCRSTRTVQTHAIHRSHEHKTHTHSIHAHAECALTQLMQRIQISKHNVNTHSEHTQTARVHT